MADPVTIEDIYELFRASQQESDRRSAALDRQLAELAAEANRRSADADRRAADADRRLTRIERLAAQASQEVSRLGSRWGQYYRLYGAVAAIEIDENVDRYAYQQGLFVIRQRGDAVEIANNATFEPTAW
jgi:ribosomal protein L9